MTAKPAQKNKTPEDYEKLGRMIEEVYETGFTEKKRFFFKSFLRGLIIGFAGIVGATLGVALLLWALSLFKEIPLIGPVVDSVRHTIEQN